MDTKKQLKAELKQAQKDILENQRRDKKAGIKDITPEYNRLHRRYYEIEARLKALLLRRTALRDSLAESSRSYCAN